MHTTRRTLLGTALAAPALLTARRAAAAAAMPVAFVYVSPIGDAGWTYQHELGRQALDKELGAAVKTSFVENVNEGADAERVIRKLASDGNKLIFTTSFGYMNPTLKVAGGFPDTRFEHGTGYKRAANVATYSARFYEGRMVSGVIAGHMTRSKVLGFVAAFPIPEVLQCINAYTLAARSVQPDVQVRVVFTSSWFDPGKERAAADTLIAGGADVLTHHTDSTAVVQAGEEKGVPTVGYNSDLSRFGPKTCATSIVMQWDDYYLRRARAALDGGWTATDTWGGMAAGMIRMAPFGPNVPPEARVAAEAAQAAIVAGRPVFAGPIKDQAGAVRVAAGAALADKDILAMNWLAEGVQGKV
jgi:basic membrane protein A